MTNKPSDGSDDTSESGTRPSLDNAPTLSQRGTADASDRQNLADTLTVALPPENRAGPRRPLSELITPAPASMDRTPITDRYEGALDLMGIPDTESVFESTPVSTEPRGAGGDEGWFQTTGQQAIRRDVPSEIGQGPLPVASNSQMPMLIAGTVGVLVVMFTIGFLVFG